MVLPLTVDLPMIIERLVPQAAYGTAQQTDIDADDYAALERTWFDLRTIPTREQVILERLALIAEINAANDARMARRQAYLLALANDPGDIDAGEIGAISSLADARAMFLKMARILRLHRAAIAILRHDLKQLE